MIKMIGIGLGIAGLLAAAIFSKKSTKKPADSVKKNDVKVDQGTPQKPHIPTQTPTLDTKIDSGTKPATGVTDTQTTDAKTNGQKKN